MVDVASRVSHALDPLSVDEITEAARILGENAIGPDRYYFSQVELAEPPKAAVLASEQGSSNGHLERIAKAVVIDRQDRRSLEILLSLDTGVVLDRSEVTAGQPPFTMPEIFSIETALR
jgi:primary-amine oxidase